MHFLIKKYHPAKNILCNNLIIIIMQLIDVFEQDESTRFIAKNKGF